MTPMLTSAIFGAAGVLGAACKAYFSNDQVTFSRKSVGDVLLGLLTGILFPVLSPIPLPPSLNLLQQAAIVAAAAYVGSDIVQNALEKFGIRISIVPPGKPGP